MFDRLVTVGLEHRCQLLDRHRLIGGRIGETVRVEDERVAWMQVDGRRRQRRLDHAEQCPALADSFDTAVSMEQQRLWVSAE